MFKIITTLSAVGLVLVSGVVNPGPRYPPTKGEVWPKPKIEVKEEAYFSIDPSQFKFNITNENCDILSRSIHRYVYVFKNYEELVQKYARYAQGRPTVVFTRDANSQNDLYLGCITSLEVELTEPCKEEYPYFEMKESYDLSVAETSRLNSSSLWGILRGLETFAQLLYFDEQLMEIRMNKTKISDYPEYQHRGVLLDTSRHFVSFQNILKMLDAMAMNKMNVFHWHIVDDQSFPYVSEKFPNLSAEGAYHPSMVYTKSDILSVINYARDRGVRVVPEFDVPGHTRSWGEAYPYLLTDCYQGNKVIGQGPMNPLRNSTYKFLREIFSETQDLFPDKFFHVGGDEVELSCWASNPEIQNYMKDHNITNVAYFHSLFMAKIIPFLENKSTPVVWEEVFFERVPLKKETLVQVWKGGHYVTQMDDILRAGHRVLFSSAWYLDHLDQGFPDYYVVDPRQIVIHYTQNVTLAQGVIGGEACMWGEMIDDRNVLSRTWPRASAVAERLWSGIDGAVDVKLSHVNIPESTWRRIEEHTCRMIRRGIPAQPSGGPGYCLG